MVSKAIAKRNSVVREPDEISSKSLTSAALSSKDNLKLARMIIKAKKESDQTAAMIHLLKTPLVQIALSVIAVEYAEHQEILSGRAAGALEGGITAVVGLHALKEYGVIGMGVAGAGLGLGALIGETAELPGGYGTWDALVDWLKGSMGLTFLK